MSALPKVSRCDGVRLDFAPLERLLERGLNDIEGTGGRTRRACSATRHAELLGIQRRQLYRLRHRGLTWAQADILAIRAGWHPGDVWGRAWWALEVD